jgi:transcription initiation factor TFIIE subunit alpha
LLSFTRQETRGNAQKPTATEYFYVDYRRAIDAIKLRIHQLEVKLTKDNSAATKKKDFSCPRCGAEWAELDALDSVDPMTGNFLCKRCGGQLVFNEPTEETIDGGSAVARFNNQFAPIIDLLKEIDKSVVPETKTEVVIAERKPVPKEYQQDDGLQKLDAVEPMPFVKPTAVKGVTTGPEKVEISITTESEETAAAAAAEAERKARVQAQNALPEWMTRSTITNDVTVAGHKQEAERREREAEKVMLAATDGEEKKPVRNADIDLESFYAGLKAEEERQREQEESEEDDDEEDFEDVDVGVTANGNGTPKAKKVKLEEPSIGGSGAATPTPAEESDADDDEFEDVV